MSMERFRRIRDSIERKVNDLLVAVAEKVAERIERKPRDWGRAIHRWESFAVWLDRFMIVLCLWLVWFDLNEIADFIRHPSLWKLFWVAWDAVWVWRLWKGWGGGWWGGGWDDEPEPDPVPEEPISA